MAPGGIAPVCRIAASVPLLSGRILLVSSPRAWLLVVLLLVAGDARAAPPPDEEGGVAELVGRLHPVLVHFPIALLLAAAGLEGLARLRRREGHSESALVCLALGTAGAAVAAASGWELAHAAGRGDATLFWHRWAGVAATALAVGALAAGLVVKATRGRWARTYYHLGLLACALAVTAGSHLGGTLVHGRGYLVDALARLEPLAPYLPDADAAPPPVRWPPARLELPARRWTAREEVGAAVPASGPDETRPAPLSFAGDVQPILEARCVRCHGPKKQKGRLRLDTGEGLARVVVPGRRDASELYVRIALPAFDIEVMPPEGEPLEAAQIETIGRWIDEGAHRAPDGGGAPPGR